LRIAGKQEREVAVDAIKKEILEKLCPVGAEAPEHTASDVDKAFKKVQAKLLRMMILDENHRSDGRKSTEIRPIDVIVDFLPRTHGSVVFTRGETQSVSVCTLGGETMGQRYENLEGENLERFYLQYFFPPFSVGETGRVGAPGRREVGHGKLAERALQAALPSKEQFPYVIRIESNITESNGSSSMASVCGGCLCMMNAGVPIKRPVAGIAMGLILEEGKFTILSDILGNFSFLLACYAQGRSQCGSRKFFDSFDSRFRNVADCISKFRSSNLFLPASYRFANNFNGCLSKF